MANGNDFKGGSPWGTPPGGGNGGFRRGPTPPDIDEIIKKIQNTINRFFGGGKGGTKTLLFTLNFLFQNSLYPVM